MVPFGDDSVWVVGLELVVISVMARFKLTRIVYWFTIEKNARMAVRCCWEMQHTVRGNFESTYLRDLWRN